MRINFWVVKLCSQIRSDLAKWEDLDHPFGEKKSHDSFQGFCRSNASGFLGVVVFNTAEVQAWMKEYKFVKFQVSGITCQYLKDDYLVDIITSGKWQPSRESLRDFYIIHEIVLATEIKFHVGSGASAGAGAQINVDPLPVPVGAHLKCSKGADDGFTICGVTEDGVQPKPFPIAFRTAHIKYRKQKGAFKPPRLELGRRRGDDDGGPHVSAFVRKDEKFHIGDFFLNMDDEDDDVEPSVVPIDFDENN